MDSVGSHQLAAAILVGILPLLAAPSSDAADYSGLYFTTVGHTPGFALELEQSGQAVTFSLTGPDIDIEGTGSVSGRTMNLAAPAEELEGLEITLTFDADEESFSGSWEIGGEMPGQGTITGSVTPWPTWDVEALGLPSLATADCIELAKMERVSLFRSGAGHDYSDAFEDCRSMKHYYYPKEGVERQSVRLYSPVTGSVIGRTDEWEGELWKGTAVGIRPVGFDAFDIAIFHVDLIRDLEVGDMVTAGEEIGTSEKQDGTVTDIAVGVQTPEGRRLISYFHVLADGPFRRYLARGATSRDDFVITREARDADPLACEGQEVVGFGTLEHWLWLDDSPTPQRPSGRLQP